MNTHSKSVLMAILAGIPVLLSGCGPTAASSNPTGSERLSWVDEPINVDTTGSDPSVTGSAIMASGSESGITANGRHAMGLLLPTMTLTGSLASPTVAGTVVQADDITLSGSKIYMAYNVSGNTQAGGVDVINVSNANAPVLTSEQTYTDTDIHKVYVSGGYLYTAGARSSSTTPGAVITKMLLTGTGDLSSVTTSVPLMATDGSGNAAYAAVSITSFGTNLFALAGTNGGIYKLNTSDLSLAGTPTITGDPRDIGVLASTLFVVTGQTSTTSAQIQSYGAGTSTTGAVANGTSPTMLANAQVSESKSTIYSGSFLNIASQGYGGVTVACSADNTNIATIAAPIVSGLTAAQTTANAVTFGNGIIFVANGEAGVYMYAIVRTPLTSGCNGLSTTYLGKFTIGAGLSANNVYYANNALYVATGLGGFKLISIGTSLLTGILTTI